jgi:hypothetical protein
MNIRRTMIALFLASAPACATVTTIPLGGPVGYVPDGCYIQVEARPPEGATDLATIQASCDSSSRFCLESLEERACELGGDVLYGIQSGKAGTSAVVAKRTMIADRISRSEFHEASPEPVAESSEPAPKRKVFYPSSDELTGGPNRSTTEP